MTTDGLESSTEQNPDQTERRTEAHGTRILGVFKFGISDHIEQFAQGTLYMNTIEHFAKIETSALRVDGHEGTSHMLRGDGATLSIGANGEFVPVGELRGPIRYQPDSLLGVNVFCMYALLERASDSLVDPTNLDFGDTFALLVDFEEFRRRVTAAVAETSQELQWGLVQYFDETTYLGPIGIFKKTSRFSYQSELRVALLPGTGGVLRLNVGDLSDIVLLGRLSDLNERLVIRNDETGRRRLLIRN